MESLSVHDLTAAYALDALEPDEARAYEEHLAHCERCRRELAELSGAAGALAFGVHAPAPPESLRERVIRAARAERENVAPLRPRWTPAARAIVAAAAVVAVAFAAWAVSLSRSLDTERSARERADAVLAVLADPGAQRIALTGARGSLVVSTSGKAVLVVSGLDRAPEGRSYVAWVLDDGRPSRAGTLAGGRDVSVLALARPVPRGRDVAVTLETDPDTNVPHGRVVLSAKHV